MSLSDRGFLDLGDQRLEYRMIGPRPADAPTLVLLHEGLGAADLWGDFPERLGEATGTGVFLYSRAGYGQSSKVALPRPLHYMHDEAQMTLPRLLDAIGFRRGLLIGHSDGASIAAIYAGRVPDPRIPGFALIAPHFFIEDVTIRAIREFRKTYDNTDLRLRFSRWHADADHTARGWSDVWLTHDMHAWDITDVLPPVRAPILVLQGELDHYGTARQVEIVKEKSGGPVEIAMLPGIMHAPHREAPDETLRIVANFARRMLETGK